MAKFGPKIFLDRQIMINAGDFNVTALSSWFNKEVK